MLAIVADTNQDTKKQNEWMTGNFTVIDGGWMGKENLPRHDLKGQPGVVKTAK